MDLPAIYREAGIPVADWGAEAAIEFLADMSLEEPDASRRRQLTHFIRHMNNLQHPGLTPDKVAEDARLKVRALHELLASQTKYESDTNREIDALRVEIQKRLDEMAERSKSFQRLREHAARLAKVEEVLRPAPTAGGAG